MVRSLLMGLARNERLKRLATSLPLTRAVVERFVAGEGVEDAVETAAALAADGRLVSIDHLGEETTTLAQAERITAAYVDLVGRLQRAGLADRAEVSLKLSAVGQALPDGDRIAHAHARTVCAAAREAGTTVTIDAEDHTTTDSTLAILARLREEFPDTGAVLQAYLLRTPDDCRALAGAGSRVRLCKGAYDEPATVAHTDRAAIDRAYVRCLRILMAGEGYPMVATHDPRLIAIAQDLAERHHRGSDRFEFQMLYGIRPDEQRRLARLGHRMRIYLPYGDDWYGYLIRRMAEKPANLALFLRALVRRG